MRKHLRRPGWRHQARLHLKAPAPDSGVTWRNQGAGTPLPPKCCMTLALSLQRPRASVSADHVFGESVACGAGRAHVAVRAFVLCVCMPVEETSRCRPLCQSWAVSLCHGGR